MARARAVVLCALAAPAHGIWPFGRRTTALAKKVRSLERDTLEFESNERILLEQLRQMRLTTGELRTTLRESIAESERVAAENDAARGEARAAERPKSRRRVGAGGKTKLAAADEAAEDAAAAPSGPRRRRPDAPSRRWRHYAEAARLKKELAKTKAELKTARAPRPAARTKAGVHVRDGGRTARRPRRRRALADLPRRTVGTIERRRHLRAVAASAGQRGNRCGPVHRQFWQCSAYAPYRLRQARARTSTPALGDCRRISSTPSQAGA